ncbi:MAG: hypothetical protein JW976_11385 [Syntrophaceae bacterium]|nr:hypothetical protein [Syntrophaceae bacterium]
MTKTRYKYLKTKVIPYILLISCLLSVNACTINQSYLSDLQQDTEVFDDAEVVVDEDTITDQEMKNVEQIKLNSRGFLKKAFDFEERHRQLTHKEIHQLLAILNDRFKKSGLTVSVFEDQVLKRVHRDLEIINAFNKSLDATKHNEKDKGYELCKQNYLQEIISGYKDILKEHIGDMVKGVLPKNYEKSLSEITILKRDKENEIIRGSFKPTCLKGAIITMLVALNGDHANASILDLPKRGKRMWVDYSILFHTISLPKKIDKLSIHPDFESFTYYYKDATSPSQGELGFPHSGYCTPGYLARNPLKGISNPESCSSWVFHQILKTKYIVTTYDVMQFFRNKTGVGQRDRKYAKTREYRWLNKVLSPILTTDLRTSIKPGDLLCIRRPKENDAVIRSRNYGASGHMAIALFTTDTHIIALACTRDVPLMEGIGIQKINFEKEGKSDIMILRHKSLKST